MRAVVIGAGVGGLAAAARLTAAGHDVTVLEQAVVVGGKLGLEQAEGFRWDTGPSLLTMPHVLEELFAATGATDVPLSLRRVDPIARYHFPDGTLLDATADLDEFCERLDEVFEAGSGDDWRALMRRAAAMWRAVEQPFLRSPITAASLVRLAAHPRSLSTIAPLRTLRGLGLRYLRDPRLRMFLERYATYTGSDPRRAPATLAVIPYVEQTYGAWYVEGGLYRIAEVIADRVRERGGSIRTGTDVTAIDVEGGRVVGVSLAGGESLRCDAVVANTDARHLYRDLLPHDAARRPLRRLHRGVASLSGFVLLLGLRGGPPAAHHSVVFCPDYDAEFDAIFGPRPRPVADPTVYLAIPDDGRVAPPGSSSAFVLVNAPRQGPVDWRDQTLAAEYAERVLTVLAGRGFDLRPRIITRRVRTPFDLQQHTRAVGGAIYGTSSNGPRSAFLRPGNAGPVPGLFLVGGSAHPGGGLPLVLHSAAIVADLVGVAR